MRIVFANFPENFALRGVQEDVFPIEREEIGAFPHVAGVDRVGRFEPSGRAVGKRVERFPMEKIRGAIKKDLAAGTMLAGADAHVPEIFFLPEAGIAEAGEFGIARGK